MLDVFPSRSAGLFGRRRKHLRGARIPVTIVTGFLGAGKTTLIRRFLAAPEGQGTAVVVNEFGSVGIDDALLRSSTDQVTLLGNGCLCCNTRSDLQIALRALVAEREHGAVPHFRRVLIETSGLADPGAILQTFATDRALGGEFHLEVLLAMVDALAALDTLDWSLEARKQVILADRLVVSKCDLISQSSLERVIDRLRLLNPRAPMHTATAGDLDPHCLTQPEMDQPTARSGFVAESQHSDGVSSFVITGEEPVVWQVFARCMEILMALRGSDLLRVKGFLHVTGCQGPVMVQIVQHLAHPPVELAAWPDGSPANRLVFITRNIAEQHVRSLLSAVAALAGSDGLPRLTELE